MAGIMRQVVIAFLDSKGLKFEAPEGQNYIIAGFSANNVSNVRLAVIFDDDDRSAHIRTLNLAKVPQNKLEAMYPVLNQLNRNYRWATFSVDTDNGELLVEDDAILDLETGGDEILEELLRLTRISDQVYPAIQKAIWT